MKRRKFLIHSALATGSLYIPAFLQGCKTTGKMGKKGAGHRKLVVIQLSGGNDGLNTFIPFRNDIYYRERPKLAIPQKKVLGITDTMGLNPALEPLAGHFDRGNITVVNSVGYPNPDRSHFRSMDIWETACGSEEYLHTGWLGRFLDNECNGFDCSSRMIEMADTLSLSMIGEHNSGFAYKDPQILLRQAENPALARAREKHSGLDDDSNLAFLYKQLATTQESIAYLHSHTGKMRSKAQYPDTSFGQKLRQVADLMLNDMHTSVYFVTLGGFDTHHRQLDRHGRLLGTYAGAMDVFLGDLMDHGLLEQTLVMTFSEFGRRVRQNASQGTGHGAANNLVLMGGSLKAPGFFNADPDLEDLFNGDLAHQLDFRQVYATVLEKWMGADSKSILGRSFNLIDIV